MKLITLILSLFNAIYKEYEKAQIRKAIKNEIKEEVRELQEAFKRVQESGKNLPADVMLSNIKRLRAKRKSL
jgi:hypothetical protein